MYKKTDPTPTVGENIIATIKMRNNFCYPLKMVIFPILRVRAITIAIAIVGRSITLERKPSEKKQRTDTKKNAKRIKSDNFIRANRENIAILGKLMIGWHHNYFFFFWW